MTFVPCTGASRRRDDVTTVAVASPAGVKARPQTTSASRTWSVKAGTASPLPRRIAYPDAAVELSPKPSSVARLLCGLPPRLQRLLFGKPPAIDGQVLATDVHVLIELARRSGARSYTEQPAARWRPESSTALGAQATTPSRPIPMARVEGVTIPTEAGGLGARFYLPPNLPGGTPPPLLVYYHGGGWVIGRPRHPRRRLPLPRRGGRGRGALGRLPAGARAPLPRRDRRRLGRLRLGGGERRRRSASTRRGSPSAATAPAATWPPSSRCAPATSGGPAPAMQLLIYPVTDSADDPRSRNLFADGFLLTKADMDHFESYYLPVAGRGRRPAGLDLQGPRPLADCRPPTSPPPGSTRCATRARPTRCGCARRA